jgi:arsenate reductase
MAEVGIDISTHTSNHVEAYLETDFDLVVTVCDAARETCPVFPRAVRQVHHGFEDPDRTELSEEELLSTFRRIRDEIEAFCRRLVDTELG